MTEEDASEEEAVRGAHKKHHNNTVIMIQTEHVFDTASYKTYVLQNL